MIPAPGDQNPTPYFADAVAQEVVDLVILCQGLGKVAGTLHAGLDKVVAVD